MLLALALLTPSASAASYYFLDSGTRAIARGGAFVVGADDLSAQYYNPAALVNLDRPMFNLNGWAVGQYVRFDRADEPGADGLSGTDDDLVFDPVTNQGTPQLEPSGGFATTLGGLSPVLKDTHVALGLYVPTSPNMAYDPEGPQRYSLVDSLVWQVYAGPSVAQRITPWLSVGAGLEYTLLRVDERLNVTTVPDGSDDPANDVSLDLHTWDPARFSWNAGFLVQPTKWLDIGGSVQPAIHYVAAGQLDIQFSPDHPFAGYLSDADPSDDATAGLSYQDDDVNLYVTTPWIVRAGVQIKPTAKLKVEGDFTWTHWSESKELRIQLCTENDCSDGGVTLTHGDSPLLTEDIPITDDIPITTGFQDSVSARLGGDYTVTDWLRVSAGAHYETSAVPASRQGVAVVDGNKWGVGAGATVFAGKHLAFDVAFAQQFLADRAITDSELRQIALKADLLDPENTSVGDGKVVGNGDFASRLTFVAVGATVYLGGGAASATP